MSGSSFGNDSRDYGKLLYTISSNRKNNFDSINIPFTPDVNGTGTIILRPNTGSWYISNISLTINQETNFNPDRYNLLIPIPTFQPDDYIDFKTEFYDINNNIAPYIAEQKNINFTGSTVSGTGSEGPQGPIGLSPVIGSLTLDSFVVKATNTGEVSNWSESSGSFNVYYGLDDVTTLSVFSVYASSSIGVENTNITDSGSYSAELNNSLSTGSVTYRATYSGSSAYKTYTMTKALAGEPGSGANALQIKLSGTTNIFNFDGNTDAPFGEPTSSLTASLQNITASLI